jgi:hypothetical protein
MQECKFMVQELDASCSSKWVVEERSTNRLVKLVIWVEHVSVWCVLVMAIWQAKTQKLFQKVKGVDLEINWKKK